MVAIERKHARLAGNIVNDHNPFRDVLHGSHGMSDGVSACAGIMRGLEAQSVPFGGHSPHFC